MLWVAGDGPASEVQRRRHPESDRVHWLGALERRGGGVAPGRRRRAVRAVAAGRVLRHGRCSRAWRPAARWWPPTSRATGHAAGGHATLVPPGDVGALARALGVALADAVEGSGQSSPEARKAASSTPGTGRWTPWPSATSTSTSGPSRPPAGRARHGRTWSRTEQSDRSVGCRRLMAEQQEGARTSGRRRGAAPAAVVLRAVPVAAMRNRNRNRNRNDRNRPPGRGSGTGVRRPAAEPAAGGGGGADGSSNQNGRSGGGRRNARARPAGRGGGQGQRQGSSRGGREPVAVPLGLPGRAAGRRAPPWPGAAPTPRRSTWSRASARPQIFPAEVAANRRRAIRLCAWTAVIPALLLGLLLWVSVSLIAGIVAFVVAGRRRHVRAVAARPLGGAAPDRRRAHRRARRAPPLQHHRGPVRDLRAWHAQLSTSSTTTSPTPARSAATPGGPTSSSRPGCSGCLQPIELEGVIAHELAHVKRGDNGVSCVGITLATLFGGEKTLRRCVGESREYRADVVGASAVRYPRGLLDALTHDDGGARRRPRAPSSPRRPASDPPAGSGSTPRWGTGTTPLAPGDLDATSVRAAALQRVVRRGGGPPS